jgi:hypothetical protein
LRLASSVWCAEHDNHSPEQLVDGWFGSLVADKPVFSAERESVPLAGHRVSRPAVIDPTRPLDQQHVDGSFQGTTAIHFSGPVGKFSTEET